MNPAPGSKELLEAARALAPRIRAAEAQIDEQRELPAELAAALADAGLFRMLVPRALGGAELDVPSWLRAVELLAAADASTAWCVNQAAVFATRSAFLPREVAREIWGPPRAVVANGPPPGGVATRAPDGYRLSGRWTFSSGCRHATWLAGIARVVEPGSADETRDMRILFFPKEQATLIDHWDVRGLRGTGSHHFETHELFVPEPRAYSFRAPPLDAGPLYLVPLNLLFACGFAAVALGLARTAIDEALELCGAKRPRGVRRLLRDQAVVQRQAGEADAIWQSAEALLHGGAGAVWQALLESHAISLEQRVRLRTAGTHAIRLAAQAVDLAYEIAGSDAIYQHHPLQRRFQDMHVITQHIQARGAHYESVGRFLLGLEPDPLSV